MHTFKPMVKKIVFIKIEEVLYIRDMTRNPGIKTNPIWIFTLSVVHSLEQNIWRLIYNLEFPLITSKAD